MSRREAEFLHYFDGSVNVEFAKEITEVVEANPNVQSIQKEEWRRFIHANPFRANGE